MNPAVEALIPELDLLCIDLDDGIKLHLSYWEAMEAPLPGTEEWVVAAVKAQPGTWTARLCRAMHNLPETEKSIIYCGRCAEYANIGKRKRAERYAQIPTLPGMEPPYQIHPRCDTTGLKWMQYRLRKLTRRVPGSVIPDCRQARGWDYATRVYPNE